MSDPDESSSWDSLEKAAAQQHRQEAAEAIEIWEEGFDLLTSTIQKLDGHNLQGKPEQRVMAALFVKTSNSLRCAFELALRGYVVQALNLARTPVEDVMAYWYLRNFPSEHRRFMDPGLCAPSYNDMLQKIEAHQSSLGRPVDGTAPRSWIRGLHQFSHASGIGVRDTIHGDTQTTSYRLGPQTDVARFQSCVADLLPNVWMHSEALDNFLRLAGRPGIPDLQSYADRGNEYRERQRGASRPAPSGEPNEGA